MNSLTLAYPMVRLSVQSKQSELSLIVLEFILSQLYLESHSVQVSGQLVTDPSVAT
jgi:hypothetical protein